MAPLGILTNLWLIPVLGVSGAAWASLITLSVVNIFRFSVVYVKTRIFPMSTCWFKSLTLVAIFLLLAAFIQDMKNPWVSIVLKTLLLGLGYFSCILLFKLSPDLYNLVSKFLKFLKKE
jgi:Na+-driven multidrug efflux pump